MYMMIFFECIQCEFQENLPFKRLIGNTGIAIEPV